LKEAKKKIRNEKAKLAHICYHQETTGTRNPELEVEEATKPKCPHIFERIVEPLPTS